MGVLEIHHMNRRQEMSSGHLLNRIFDLPEDEDGQDGFDKFIEFARDALQTRIMWDARKCVFVVEN